MVTLYRLLVQRAKLEDRVTECQDSKILAPFSALSVPMKVWPTCKISHNSPCLSSECTGSAHTLKAYTEEQFHNGRRLQVPLKIFHIQSPHQQRRHPKEQATSPDPQLSRRHLPTSTSPQRPVLTPASQPQRRKA